MNLLGEFNIYNVLAAMIAFYGRGYSMESIIEQIEQLPPVKGRMEKVCSDLPVQIFIDYAHTQMQLKRRLKQRNLIKRVS